ncbi:MAG: response regulator [Phycisphaerales bacterium]|nr:response regulator [Phycisphaerales bacterium]
MNEDLTPAQDLAAGLETHRPTILLVDDNEQNLELLLAYLEDLPCTVQTATDGVQALEKMASLNPDLVVLDIMMPRMSGYQVCERIKADPAMRDTPVVMVTALNEVGDVERAVDAGADDFLTKPVNRLELVTRVTSLLRVRDLKRQLDKAVEQVRHLRDQP